MTIAANAETGTGTFVLAPVEDRTDEGAGETVALTGTTSAADPVGAAAVTIVDDDLTSTQVALELRPSSVLEDGGARSIDVTAELDEGARTEVTVVTLTVGDGTASAPGDYSAHPATFPLTIPPDVRRVTLAPAFTLDPVSDRIDEGDEETVRVTGSTTVAALEVEPATVAIDDNDRKAVVLEPAELDVNEGGQAVYRVRLDSQPTGTVTVTASVASGSGVSVSGALTFATGNWETAQPVTVTAAENDVPEGHRDLEVRHAAAGADYDGLLAPSLALRFLDNDGPAVESVSILGSPRDGERWRRGETIRVKVTFDSDLDNLDEATGPAGAFARPRARRFRARRIASRRGLRSEPSAGERELDGLCLHGARRGLRLRRARGDGASLRHADAARRAESRRLAGVAPAEAKRRLQGRRRSPRGLGAPRGGRRRRGGHRARVGELPVRAHRHHGDAARGGLHRSRPRWSGRVSRSSGSSSSRARRRPR